MKISLGDTFILSYLQQKKSHLLYAGAEWFKSLTSIGLVDDAVQWGPTSLEFENAILDWWGKTLAAVSDSDDSSYYTDSVIGEEDLVAQQMELLHLAESQNKASVAVVETRTTPRTSKKRARTRDTP